MGYTCFRPQRGNLKSAPEARWLLLHDKATFPDIIQLLFQLQQTLETTSDCFLQLVLGSSTSLSAAIILGASAYSSQGVDFTL